MSSTPKCIEIDHHTLKLIVGLIALSLAGLTSFLSENPLQSISAAWHEGGWPRDIFVGFLFAIAVFLFAYTGYSKRQNILSKIAAFAALGVALFPCKCKIHQEIIPNVHAISAVLMFIILALFCYLFYKRAIAKDKVKYPRTRWRAGIYLFCGSVIVLSIAIMTVDNLLDEKISSVITRLTFYGEATALVAFGIAWLTASRIIPLLTGVNERLAFAIYRETSASEGNSSLS